MIGMRGDYWREERDNLEPWAWTSGGVWQGLKVTPRPDLYLEISPHMTCRKERRRTHDDDDVMFADHG